MANYYGPLVHTDGTDSATVIDPRFGVSATPTQPSGWGGGSGGYDPRFGTDPLPVQPAGWGGGEGTIVVDTEEIWVDTDYTGATDAAADINAALLLAYQAGQARGVSLTVRLKPGILRLSSSPILVGRRVRLIGSGMRHTRLQPIGSTVGIEQSGVYSSAHDDIHISDLEIDGSLQSTGAGAGPKGITGSGGLRVTLRNLYVHHTAATGIGWDSFGGVIENCWAVGCGRNAKITTVPGNSGFGIGVGNPNSYPPVTDYPNWNPLSVSNCHAIDNGNYGFFFETQNAANIPVAMSILGCTSRNNGRDGIGLDGGTSTIIQGCTIHNNAHAGVGLNWGTMGLDKGGYPTRYAQILGNHIRGNAYGVRARTDGTTYDLIGMMVKDNQILTSTNEGVLISAASTGVHRDLWVEGNHIEGGTIGVRLIGTSSVDRLAVAGNRVKGMTGAAVSIGAPTTNVRVTGNEGWSNGSGVYFNTALTHTGHRIDTTWVEGTDTLPS